MSKSLKQWCDENDDFGRRINKEWTGIDINCNYLDINNITYGSHKKMIWKCIEHGHSYKSTIANRVFNKTCCPECCKLYKKTRHNSYIATGKNDLYTWCLEHKYYGYTLLEEWIGKDDRGNKLDINNIAYGSNIKAKFKCKVCNNEYYAYIHNRTTRLTSCPFCSNVKIKIGFNDLYTWCKNNADIGKDIILDWTGETDSNEKIKLSDIVYGSNKRMKWVCNKCGNLWYTSISNRTLNGTGCTVCKAVGTSYPEQFIYNALKQIFPKTVNRGKLDEYEFDIAIPELRTCIEYSPTYWHNRVNAVNNDKKKINICKKHNIRLIYIREDTYNEYNEVFSEDYICFHMKNHHLGKKEKQLIKSSVLICL